MMRKILPGILVVFLLGVGVTRAEAGWDPLAQQKAQAAIAAFKAADPTMSVFFDEAYGYAVFPTVGKGAIGIGGAHGEGTVYEQGRVVGSSELIDISIGFQLGGQSYREIIFFKDAEAMRKFKLGQFALNADASAVAATKGASATTDYSDGVAIFTTITGGLMFEASVGGQKFTFTPIS